MTRWYVSLAVIALLMSMAGQSQARLEWIDPGRAPYTGSADGALEIFARKVLLPGTYERLPRQILERQFEMWRSGECTRREIRPGEYFGYMLFKRGSLARDVHADTEAWRKSASTQLTECIVVDHEHRLVFKLQRPDVCHNWTYTIAPLLPPLPWGGPFGLPPNAVLPMSGGGFGFPAGGGGAGAFTPFGTAPEVPLSGGRHGR
jgi:hypothetical protein